MTVDSTTLEVHHDGIPQKTDQVVPLLAVHVQALLPKAGKEVVKRALKKTN